MRKLISIFVLLVVAVPALCADKKLLEIKKHWKPAAFRGLIMGKATFRDLVLAYPHPAEVGYWSVIRADGAGYDSDVTPTRYEVGVDGAAYKFEIRKGLVQRIWSPIDSLLESEKEFGKDYIEVTYEYCDAAKKGGNYTIHRTSDTRAGDFLVRYNPHKGIVVRHYYASPGAAVSYEAHPFETRISPKCPDPWYLRSARGSR